MPSTASWKATSCASLPSKPCAKGSGIRLAQQTAQALAVDKIQVTRYLYYASAKDTVPTLKQFLSPRGDIVADERTNSLIISDIPSSLPNVDRLLKELDRKTQQVEIEARVVAATRNFARDIGTQLAFGFGNKATAIGGNGNVGNSTITTNPAQPIPDQRVGGRRADSLVHQLPRVRRHQRLELD